MAGIVPISGSYNGLTFGQGTAMPVVKLEGWDDLPNILDTDVKRAQDQGAYAGLDLGDEWHGTLDLALLGAWSGTQDFAAFLALYDQVIGATTVQGAFESALVINDGVRNRQRLARPRRRKLLTPYEMQRRNGVVSIEFCATDPRKYDAAQSNGSSGPGTGGTGFTFPFTFPFTFGAGATGNTFVATNAGSFSTNPVATISGGAITNPSIQNVTAGLTMLVNITLMATDTLVIDFGARTIVLNGTASRRSLMDPSSRWWSLAPGANTIKFLGTPGAGNPLLTLTWRSAWL